MAGCVEKVRRVRQPTSQSFGKQPASTDVATARKPRTIPLTSEYPNPLSNKKIVAPDAAEPRQHQGAFIPGFESLTLRLVVLHLGSRRVFYSPATYNPDRPWLQQQVRNVAIWADEEGIQSRFMIRDNDQIFNFAGYDDMLKQIGVEAVHTPLYSPRANAFVESHIGSVKRECLDYFVCFSLDQLNRIVSKWRRHFLDHRPHQGKGIGNKPLDKSFVPKETGPVRCASSLAGLLKGYYRDSA